MELKTNVTYEDHSTDVSPSSHLTTLLDVVHAAHLFFEAERGIHDHGLCCARHMALQLAFRCQRRQRKVEVVIFRNQYTLA